MLAVCAIMIAVGSKDLPFLVKADVEGKILKESSENYLMDFSVDIKKRSSIENPEDWKKILVKKSDCVKE